jgi:hypothetical protein
VEAIDNRVHQTLLLAHDALGDLDVQKIVRYLKFADVLIHNGKHIAKGEIKAGKIDGNGDRCLAAVNRPPYAAADLADDVAVKQVNEVCLLQSRYENIGPEEAQFRINPAGKCLKAAKLAGNGTHHRLIIRLYIAPGKGILKAFYNAASGFLVHSCGVSFRHK